MVLKPKKQALNSLVLKDFGGDLSYSWSRQNAAAGRKDAKVYTTLTGTLEHLHSLLEPLDDSKYGNKNDAGYITPAMVLRTNPAKESSIKPGMNHRCDASVRSSSIVTLDIDDATPADFEADLRTVRRSRDALTLYTTASHTDDAPRYRIVAVVDAPLFGDNIVKARYGLVAMLFDGRKLDKASFTLSQAMYRPYTNSEVFHSKGIRLFDAAELVAECPEGVRVSEGSRNTTLSDEEAAKVGAYREWMEAACFELEGAFNGTNLLLTPTPDHACDVGYTSDVKLGDFQFCPPRDGFGAPNVTLLHDSDKVAVEGMSGREKMAYMVKAVGMPDWLENDLYKTLGWSASNIACNDDDLADEPAFTQPDYIVEGLMPAASVWGVVADSESYKSFYILGMMAISAAGYRFAGADTRKAHHFYIDGEGGVFTSVRLKALASMYGAGILNYIHVKSADEIDITDHKAVIQWMHSAAGNEPVGLVAFDTLNQTFGVQVEGFNENSSGRDGMGRVIEVCKAIRNVTGAAVGVIHHTPRGGNNARGSGAFRAGLDVEIFIQRRGDLRIDVEHRKSKNGAKQPTVGMELDVVAFADAPPPKEFGSEEFTGRAPTCAKRREYFIPEYHKAPVLVPFGYEPWGESSGTGEDSAMHAALVQKLINVPSGVTWRTLRSMMTAFRDVGEKQASVDKAIKPLLDKGIIIKSGLPGKESKYYVDPDSVPEEADDLSDD